MMKPKRYIAEKPEVEELFWIQSYKINFALKKDYVGRKFIHGALLLFRLKQCSSLF